RFSSMTCSSSPSVNEFLSKRSELEGERGHGMSVIKSSSANRRGDETITRSNRTRHSTRHLRDPIADWSPVEWAKSTERSFVRALRQRVRPGADRLAQPEAAEGVGGGG